MGGPGSGWKNDRAQTVEECLSITIGRFKPGDLHPGSSSVGSLCWNGSDGPLTVGGASDKYDGDRTPRARQFFSQFYAGRAS